MKYNKTAKKQGKYKDAKRRSSKSEPTPPPKRTPVRPPSGRQIGYAITLPIGTAKSAPPPQSPREQSRQKNATRHKRRRKRNYTLHYTFLIILAIITIVIMSYTVLFNVKHITITNTTSLDTQKLIDASGAKVGNNLLRLNTKKMEDKILKSTIFLDSVDVKRKFPATLDIELTLSKVTQGVNYGRMYYYFSQTGRCIEISETNTHEDVTVFWGVDLNKIKLGEYLKPTEQNQLELANVLSTALKKGELENIQAIDLRDLANLTLYYESQIEIKIGNTTDLEYKLKMAKEVISEKITDGQVGVLDVRIVGKAYFKAVETVKHPS